jgi:hypothetical protein
MQVQSPLESTEVRGKGPITACAAGTLSPNVALARLIALATSRAMVERSILEASAMHPPGSAGRRRLGAMLDLWRDTPSAWDIVRGILALARHDDPELGTRWAEVFDAAAQVSPSGGVALYSLGRADLLAAATDSIVARMREWDLLGGKRTVLDLGCGSGRLVAGLAPAVRAVVGADISPVMLDVARRRTCGLPNVMLVLTSGRDLGCFRDGSFDGIAAVDVLPYMVSGTEGLVETHFAEARRVLAPGGTFLILNFAYGREEGEQQSAVAQLCWRHGFSLVRAAAGDFALWDGRTFHLRREG